MKKCKVAFVHCVNLTCIQNVISFLWKKEGWEMYPISHNPLQLGWLNFLHFLFFFFNSNSHKHFKIFTCVSILIFLVRSCQGYYCSPVDPVSSGSYCQKENFFIPGDAGHCFTWATRIKVIKRMDSCNIFKACFLFSSPWSPSETGKSSTCFLSGYIYVGVIPLPTVGFINIAT